MFGSWCWRSDEKRRSAGTGEPGRWPHRRPRPVLPSLLTAAGILLTLLVPAALRADDFPPITDAERAVTSVPGEPNAPAVMLFKKGELQMAGFGLRETMASSLKLQVRLKILTEEGKSSGEVSISHSVSDRLHGFRGRTVLPDGRVLPVPDDAKFVRKTSRSRKTYNTAVAFPGVQVGAILDYEYEIWFDSIFYLEPWYFSDDMPVLHSEIVFKTPYDMGAQSWSRGPVRVQLQRQTDRAQGGYVTRVWGEGIPSVPQDPYGLPFEDLALQMLLLPTSWGDDKLMASWPDTCRLIGRFYDEVRRHDSGVEKTALATAGSGTPRDKAQALYRFVRDQVENNGTIGVSVNPDHALGKILSDRKGSRAEKALLLQAMLKAAKVDSRLVWAADRDGGTVDLQLPNPHWFDAVLVRVDLDGKPVFLDPNDRTLAFGRLSAGYEGTPALVFDPKQPETVTLPETPYAQNLQRAEIDLTLDAQGRLAGSGTLRLTGQQAWRKIVWPSSEDETLKTWKEWLEKRYREFQVSNVKVAETVDDQTVTVTWALAQREEEVLGDESTLIPSAPVGPLKQPFVQPASSRRSAVRFDYPYRDEVELKLRWPEGWKLAARPAEEIKITPAGRLTTEIELREAERVLVFHRQVDLTQREIKGSQDYESIRSFFGEVEKNDAQKLVLAKR